MKSLEVSIGGRMIPLKIDEKEEQMILDVVTDLNNKLRELQVMYASKDMQDCMAMTLLTFAFEANKNKQVNTPSEVLQDKLKRVHALLDEMAA